MKTATKIKQMANFKGQAALYKLSEPLDSYRYVIVSSVQALYGPETAIFGSDKHGDSIQWDTLPGSTKGILDHLEALNKAGYEVVPEVLN